MWVNVFWNVFETKLRAKNIFTYKKYLGHSLQINLFLLCFNHNSNTKQHTEFQQRTAKSDRRMELALKVQLILIFQKLNLDSVQAKQKKSNNWQKNFLVSFCLFSQKEETQSSNCSMFNKIIKCLSFINSYTQELKKQCENRTQSSNNE
jgi:hypothetical protein